MKGSINNQLNNIERIISGIGKSKKKRREEVDFRDEKNKRVSDKIHSYLHIKHFRSTVKELALFCVDKQNKIEKNLNAERFTALQKRIKANTKDNLNYYVFSKEKFSSYFTKTFIYKKRQDLRPYEVVKFIRDEWETYDKKYSLTVKKALIIRNKIDIERINDDDIKEFIDAKITKKLKYRSISTYISRLYKLRVALVKIRIKKFPNETEENNNFPFFSKDSLKIARAKARIISKKSEHVDKSYLSLEGIRKNIDDPNVRLAFDIQCQTGCRADESLHYRRDQLLGSNMITFKNKGGKIITKTISKELYIQLSMKVEQGITRGMIGWKLEYIEYYKKLKLAIEKDGQTFKGTHGIRYNYAQDKFMELIDKGKDFDEALFEVSDELGHKRKGITLHYL